MDKKVKIILQSVSVLVLGAMFLGTAFTIEAQGGPILWTADNNANGFTLFGDNAPNGNLILNSTSTGAKGNIILNPTGGNVGIGTAAPGAKLEVAGKIKITGGNPGAGKVLTSDKDGLANWQPRQWSPVGQTQDIYHDAGNVGVGTSTPTTKLEVVGQVKITGGTPGAGKFLTSDASGLASWANLPPSGNSQWTTSGANIYYNNGNVGIGTTSPVTKLHLAGDASVFANGTVGSGFILGGSGEAGTMMLWYSRKAAFRAGLGKWSDSTIGKYSFATGFLTSANGERSAAMGDNTNADSYASVALGKYNVGGGDSSAWNTADPLFEIGIGSSANSKANALTVLKNGDVGIGTATPSYSLELATDSAAKPNGGSWSSTSDSRLKKDVVTYTGALEKRNLTRSLDGIN